MKILYLRLKNSAGIYAGTGRKEIEIDFNKSNNDIIMLFGGNGSGKSTIISSLSPFNGTNNDERSQFYIKETNGEKEIHYKMNDNVYMIRHYTSDKNKTKSFISVLPYKSYINEIKNKPLNKIYESGNELNENGGVLTFKEVIKDKFGIDEEFFKISRIGSNVTNFIDLSTANRKKYISTFLPNIDNYLEAYNTVSGKYKLLKNEIDFISDEILKIDNKESLNEKIDLTRTNLNNSTINYEEMLKRETDLKTKIRMLDENGYLESFKFKNPFEIDYNKYKELFENIKIKINDETNVENKISELEKEHSNQIFSLNSLNIDSVNFEKEINRLQNELDNKKQQIKKIDKIDINELNDLINEKKKLISEYNDDINQLNFNLNNYNDNFINYGDSLFDKINVIKKYNDIINSIVNFIKNLSYEYSEIILKFIDNDVYDKFILDLNNKEVYYNELRNKFMELKVLYKSQESNLDKLEILKNRPITCSDDTCPFIKDALKYKNLESEINQTKEELIFIKNEIDNINNDINNLKLIKDKFESLVKSLPWNNNIIEEFYNLFSKEKYDKFDKYAFISFIYNEFKNNNFKDYYKLNDYIEVEKNKQYINETEESISKLEEKLNYSSKMNDILNTLNLELNKIYDDIVENDKEFKKLKIKKEILKEEMQKVENELKDLNDYIEYRNNYNKYKDEYESAKLTLERINQYKNDYIYANNEKKRMKEEVERNSNLINNYRMQLARLLEYENRKNSLEENFTNISLIRDALNPTKGIPVYFIQNYLDKTKLITNKLLDISQKGKMAINFEISDKDFFIKVYKNNGDILEDIKEASQGEIALVTLSLSLALIEQSTSKYNIFLLDELDGALDTKNRRSFLDMIEIQMKSLSSEQVFVISHNQEFENYPIDMILLSGNNINTKDKDFMSNKNILFQL